MYTIRIRKTDTGYEATVDELPDITEYGDTYSEVMELIIDSIETTEAYHANEDQIDP